MIATRFHKKNSNSQLDYYLFCISTQKKMRLYQIKLRANNEIMSPMQVTLVMQLSIAAQWILMYYVMMGKCVAPKETLLSTNKSLKMRSQDTLKLSTTTTLKQVL